MSNGSGQRCPKPFCGGTILYEKDQYGPRLRCSMCPYQEDPYSEDPFQYPSKRRGWNRYGPRTPIGPAIVSDC